MDNGTSRPQGSDSFENNKKKQIVYYVGQLAIGLAQVIPSHRIAMYVQSLQDMSEKQLAFGFRQALQLFQPGYGVNFPVPAQIREWGEQWRPEQEQVDNQRLLDRPAKPEGTSDEERQAFAKRIIAEMTEKVATAKYDMPDPQPQDYDEPNHGKASEHLAAQRTGTSKVPVDPESRRQWASQRAKDTGWL